MRAVFANYHGMSLSDEDWDNIIEDFLHDPEPYLEFGDYFHQSQTFRNLLPVKGMPELVFDWILLSAKTRKKSRNSQTLFRLFFYAPLRLYIR